METTEKKTHEIEEFEKTMSILIAEKKNRGQKPEKLEFIFFLIKRSYEKELKNLRDETQIKVQEQSILLASEDEKKNLIVEGEGYAYKKDKRIELDKKVAEINRKYSETSLSVTVFDVPKDIWEEFSMIQQHIFQGFLKPQE